MIDYNKTYFIGQPRLLTVGDMITTCISLVIGAWPRVREDPAVAADPKEEIISGILKREIGIEKRNRNIEGPPLILDEVAEHGFENSIKPVGWIDFKFFFSFDNTPSWGLECKRISSTDNSLLKYYISGGICRFVEGKYCPGHASAGMLAYVIDNEIKRAIEALVEKLKEDPEAVKWDGIWQEVTELGNFENLFLTNHKRDPNQNDISIFHLFVAMN